MAGKKLYNPNDNITGRDGGPYLDLVEAEQAEKRRAQVEDRKPSEDFVASAGIPLVTGEQLLPTASVNNLPSQNQFYGLGVADSVTLVNDREENAGLHSVGEIPENFVPHVSSEDTSTDTKNTGGQQATTSAATKVADSKKTTK